jgi:hypothetical protein
MRLAVIHPTPQKKAGPPADLFVSIESEAFNG